MADTPFVTVQDYMTPDSNPWGDGGARQGAILPLGVPANTEKGFYDQHDTLVGGTDTAWNLQTADTAQSGANWFSASDNAQTFNSFSGLNGPIDDDGPVWTPGTRFSGTLSQSDLAG